MARTLNLGDIGVGGIEGSFWDLGKISEEEDGQALGFELAGWLAFPGRKISDKGSITGLVEEELHGLLTLKFLQPWSNTGGPQTDSPLKTPTSPLSPLPPVLHHLKHQWASCWSYRWTRKHYMYYSWKGYAPHVCHYYTTMVFANQDLISFSHHIPLCLCGQTFGRSEQYSNTNSKQSWRSFVDNWIQIAIVFIQWVFPWHLIYSCYNILPALCLEKLAEESF